MNLEMSGTQLLIILLQGLLIIAISVLLARAKKRSPVFWGILSLIFGIYALFVLVLLPKKQLLPKQEGTKPSEPVKEEGASPLPPQSVPQEPLAPTFSAGQLQTADWYFINEKKESEGPFRLKKMQEMVSQGKLGPQSWVWCELLPQWKKIENDPELQKALCENQKA